MLINGIDVHRDNTCSSHMPIQMEFIKKFQPKKVLGCWVLFNKIIFR